MSFGSSRFGSSQFGEDLKIIEALDKTELIPVDAKIAIKDFLSETYEKIWSSIKDLKELTPPEGILEYWNVLIKILESIV